jgi:hypothetical protein
MLNYEEIRRRTIEAEIKKSWWIKIRSIRGIYDSCRHRWKVQMKGRKVWI